MRAIQKLCALLLLLVSIPILAQKDVITITSARVGAADAGGDFKKGAPSTEYQGVYVIDVGDMPAIFQTDEDGCYEPQFVTVTLSRPQGATAKRAATVKLGNMKFWGEGPTVTFEPGETTKTVEIPVQAEPSGWYEDENGEWHDLFTWSGNLPEIYTITTTYADAEYDALMLKVNRTGADTPRQSTFATKLEVLQNTFGNDHANYSVTRWGDYILFRFFLATDVKIGTDSRYVINARFADHTGMGPDDDDFGMAQMHEVELHPINAGSVCSEAWYIYKPTPDEYLHSYPVNLEFPNESGKAVEYPILEVGPFEVANPADDAVKYIFYTRADLPEESANSLFGVYFEVDGLRPEFSNVRINKTAFKSGETIIITATMDNWQFVKRCQNGRFRSSFGVTLNDNESLEPGRYTFDELTGLVTYYVTAPTVTETKTVYVDFGPACRIADGNTLLEKAVQTSAERSFAVTVSPEAAKPNPITEFDIPGLPADGSLIVLKKTEEYLGNFIWDTRVYSKEYGIDPVYSPFDATNVNQISYSVTNADGANAQIIYNGLDGITLSTGVNDGSFTFTASIGSEVKFSRTYTLMAKEGEEELAMPVAKNHTNHYYVGTVFPKFQFELKNPDNRPVDDDITVTYTHVNGQTWTEKYKLSKLQKYDPRNDWSAFADTDRGTITYDLPFSFSDEHPDIADDSQIGKTVITAQVLITMPTTEGPKKTIECTSVLISDLKKISFGDYNEFTAAYNDAHPVTLTSEVMYLPRMGFTVGYEIPELNEKKMYNSLTDGDNVPEWLQLEKNEYYCTANITVHPTPDHAIKQYNFFTLAQRSYNPDEVMLRELTSVANLEFVGPEGHILFRVNGKDATGNLTFDNGDAIQNLIQTEIQPAGFMKSSNDRYHDKKFTDILLSTFGSFVVYDDVYEGADVTLKCGDEVIQTMKNFKGTFDFLPPMDGRTYTVEVYFTGYDRRYTATFVSHPFTNVYRFDGYIYHVWDTFAYYRTDLIRWYDNGTPKEIVFPLEKPTSTVRWYHGYVYIENPTDFYLSYREASGKDGSAIRVGALPLKPVKADFGADLYNQKRIWSMEMAENADVSTPVTYHDDGSVSMSPRIYYSRWLNGGSETALSWADLASRNTKVNVVNSQGEPITNATLNYGCADNMMTLRGNAGSTKYDTSLNAYQVETDPDAIVEFIEVVAPGYQPMLTRMYISDYNHNSRENKGKMRNFTIVLDENANTMKSLSLETMKRNGNLKDNKMQACVNYDDLLMLDNSETLDYSETADYKTVTKYMNDGKFGRNGWNGTKWVHLTGQMDCDASFDASQLRLTDGTFNLEPTLAKVINSEEFTTFAGNYCLFDFDLTDQIAEDATVKPALKSGDETLAEIPALHNHTIDLMALNEANNITMDPGGFNLNEVDNQAQANGTDMKDMGKAFDKFNFQLPSGGLPFTVNIERDGDYFLIRAVCEVNFLPGGPIMDALDELGDLQYFDEQFQACIDAVNSAKPADDDFFDDIPRWPSAFVGIKGYLSGIGYINPDDDTFQFNFYDGGLTFEASAAASANLSFGIGHFGMSIDAKMAMTMGLVNTAAEMGDVSFKSTKIDFVFDYQTRLKVCAWAYAGIDVWIAKAVAGVRGGACFDLHHRAYVTKGQAGMKTTLHAQMEAFAEVRFLFWKAKKTWPIFKAHKEYLVPNNPSNPFHPDNDEPIFSMSRRNVTKGYKRLKRKVIADLGTPIIEKVNGMAQPTYLMDGKSLLFNNLKTAKDYNDDRLQVFADGSKDDFIDTGVKAPMYDFSTSRNPYFEMAAFEQLEEPVDGNAIEGMAENDQTKAVSEKSRIYMAWRLRDGSALEEAPMFDWQMKEADNAWGKVACVNPVVATAPPSDNGDLTKTARGAVVWQQGLAKFNDEGSRYIDGSLMLKRQNYFYAEDLNTEPIEIKRINRRNVPVDYQMAMKNDSVLVMMTLKQDVDNQDKGASVVYVSVSPDDKVRERYTMIEGTKPQMVNVAGGILVAYLKQNKDGRDLVLNTVNMKGESTGKLSGSLGMERRMINDYKLVTQRNGGVEANLSNVALLWSQSDEERTDNADGTTTVIFKNRIYASMLRSHDKQLYFSAPVEIATMPDDVTLVSMDGYLDGLDMKVAYCVANEEDGSAVLENQFTFTNAIDHKASFNPYEVADDAYIPVKITVANNGIDPISCITVNFGDESEDHHTTILPQQSTELTVNYPVPDNFDGTIDYDVTATFTYANSGELKSRRLGAKARPMRVQQSGTQMDVRQVDMALKVISKRTDAEGKTTIVAEVNNASLLPLASDMSVKVALYDSPIATEKAAGTTEVTVSASDLYDATAEQKNKVKIVSLTANQPTFAQTLYLRTTPMQGSEVLTDTKPSNNVLPVRLKGKCLKGDVNNDGKVNMADVSAIILHISGKTPAVFNETAADVNQDGIIDIADVIGVTKITGKVQ